MLGENKPKPKVKGRMCDSCGAWYRPSRYRSGGPELQFCSLKCARKAVSEAAIRQKEDRQSGRAPRNW